MRGVVATCSVVVLGCGSSSEMHVVDGRTNSDSTSADVQDRSGLEVDTTFGTNGTLAIPIGGPFYASITMLPNEVAMVSLGSIQSFTACRILGDGTRDPSFGGGACITRDWWVSRRQVAPDGDAVLVAANRPLTGPRVYRLLADGSDDASFGPVNLTPPSGFGSESVATGLRRLGDGTYIAYGLGNYVPNGSTGSWAQRMQQDGTTSPAVLISQSLTISDMLDVAGQPTFVLERQVSEFECPLAGCSGNDVCRYGACVAPPATCAGTCMGTAWCDMNGECLPDDVGPAETRVLRTAADLSTTISDVTVPNRSVHFAATQVDGRLLLAQEFSTVAHAGLWRVSPANGADATFGVNGLAVGSLSFSTAMQMADGRIIATENGGAFALHELTNAGVQKSMLPNPYLATSITDIVEVPNGKVLTVALGLQMLIVQRFIVNP
jgi:hypothetical protein